VNVILSKWAHTEVEILKVIHKGQQAACTSAFRRPAVDGITYLVACHYSLIALFSVVFCVLLYVANKLSLSLHRYHGNLLPMQAAKRWWKTEDANTISP